MVLNAAVVVVVAESEGVRRHAVLVVDHLGVVAVPQNVGGGLDFILAVRAGTDVLSAVGVDPDGNVLPVVGVAWVGKVGDSDVLLEVVAVQIGTPAIVAALSGVDIAGDILAPDFQF